MRWCPATVIAFATSIGCHPARPQTDARVIAAAPLPAAARPSLVVPLVPPGELTDDLVPVAYRLELELDPGATEYAGTVEIDVTAARALPALWWNAASDLVLDKVEVRQGGQLIATREVIGAEAGGDVAGVVLATPLAVGPATLRIGFRGSFRATDGIFRQRAGTESFVYSDFEPTDARNGFPCFDEPRWRAPLTLTIRSPDGTAAYANMPEVAQTREDDWVVRQFAPTPPLPTYLFAFAVGRFVEVPVPDPRLPIRILAPVARSHVDHARAELPAIIARSVEFIGQPWPWPKLDVLVVPIMQGAMENPGLITVAADIVDAPVDESDRAVIELVLAHEISHAWFGAVVTPRDWRDLWLNEGLATWMSDRTLRTARSPRRTAAAHVLDRIAVYDIDDPRTAHPLRPTTVATPRDMFDPLSYQKGGATMHAIVQWLGDAAVRGIHFGAGRQVERRIGVAQHGVLGPGQAAQEARTGGQQLLQDLVGQGGGLFGAQAA